VWIETDDDVRELEDLNRITRQRCRVWIETRNDKNKVSR